MKKIFFVTIVLFSFFSIITANTQNIQSVNITTSATTVYRSKSVSGQYAYNNSIALGLYNRYNETL